MSSTVAQPHALLVAGQTAVENGNYGTAIAALSQLALISPAFEQLPLGHHLHGMALASSGRAEEAFRSWRRALDVHDRTGGTSKEFHDDVMSSVNKAAAAFVQTARLQPASAELQHAAAVALATMGDQAGAVSVMQAALRLDPSSAALQQQAGTILAPTLPREAAALLRSALHGRPAGAAGGAAAHLTLARLDCGAFGEGDSACRDGCACLSSWLAAFDAAARASPPDPELLRVTASSAGKMLCEKGREAEALALGVRAMALGGLLHPRQMPRELVRGVRTNTPWRDDAVSWRSVRLLEASAPLIRDEVRARSCPTNARTERTSRLGFARSLTTRSEPIGAHQLTTSSLTSSLTS